MITLIKKILGIKTIDYNQLMMDGAIVIDVRTTGEFNSMFRSKKDLMFQLLALQSVTGPKRMMNEERNRTVNIIEKLNNLNDQNLNRSPYVMGLFEDRKQMYLQKKELERISKQSDPTYYSYEHKNSFYNEQFY